MLEGGQPQVPCVPALHQDQLEDVLVLRDRLGRAAVQSSGEPVFGERGAGPECRLLP